MREIELTPTLRLLLAGRSIAGGADQFIQVPADSTGKKISTEELTEGASTTQRQRIQVTGAVLAEVARVLNANPASTDYGLVVRGLDDIIDRALRDLGKVDVALLDQYTPIDVDETGGVLQALPVRAPNGFNSGALGALNAAVALSAQGTGTVHWEINTGTLVGTVVFEATLDDTNWFAVNAIRIDGTILASTTTFADRGALTSTGYSQVRLRVSAFTSGTSNARVEASSGASVVRLGQALPPGTNNIGDVDVLSIAAGANRIGKVTIRNAADAADIDPLAEGTFTGRINTQGQKAMAASTPVVVASDQSVIPVSDNAGSLTVDAPVGTPVAVRISDGAAFIDPRDVSDRIARLVGQVDGRAAHDAAVAGNPHLVAARANLNEPAVVADGDVTHLWADQLGRLVVLTGHANPEAPVTVNGSAAGVSVIGAPGVSLSLYICKGSIHNRGVEQVISLRDGAAGTIRFTMNAAADGGGTLFDFGARGWKLTANTALVADIAAASADVNVTEYYIAE